MPTWVAALAFLAANLGAQEVIGMCASGAKYGLITAHFNWAGAAPAMLFVGVFMAPFPYGSRARSVPECLKLRFDEKPRAFNAVAFAALTVVRSGISMYAVGLLFQLVLGGSFTASILLSAVTVLLYTLLGRLSSAIYNEVLQVFRIVIGLSPLAFLAVERAGGWEAMAPRLLEVMTHTRQYRGEASANPTGVEIFGQRAGLASVLSFSYWWTDFLVILRVMAARSMEAARRVPLLAAFLKMIMPWVVIPPGIAAPALNQVDPGFQLPMKGASANDDQTLTTLKARFYPPGLLALGVTALFASFMSGMAGQVTAFNTVFTDDLYQGYLQRDASDAHYRSAARSTSVWGIGLSIATAYLAQQFNNLMDFLQPLFGFVNAPLFATFLIGMFWKRATGDGAFWGLLLGTLSAALTHGLNVAEGKGGWLAVVHQFPSTMAQNFWIAVFAWTACFLVTMGVSWMTTPKSPAELNSLVFGLTLRSPEDSSPAYLRPAPWALAVLAVLTLLKVLCWWPQWFASLQPPAAST